MFSLLAVLSISDICQALYNKEGCPVCVTHFADRQCGWCATTMKCIQYNESSSCPSYYYGPKARCTDPKPAPYVPTATPKPTPTPIPSECSVYDDCDVCTTHYADRKCGWCATSNKCESSETSKCPAGSFYHGDNAQCGGVIPPPTPTPWPVYEANPTFCYALSGKWCTECVTAQANMSCGWCHETKECIMGDKEGPFFGRCDTWSSNNDDVCMGKSGKSSITAVRAVIAVFITVVILASVAGCYKVIKNPAKDVDYDPVK